jgi:hypothetical protein
LCRLLESPVYAPSGRKTGRRGFLPRPGIVTQIDGGDERRRRKGFEEMKYVRAAAVVIGSVAAMAASPAYAASTTSMPPMSLNGGLAHTLGEVAKAGAKAAEDTSTVGRVTDTAMELNNIKGDAPQQVLKTAGSAVGEVAPLLGTIDLGH